ncbi:ParB/RepB/Spo0J family partition protein [Lactovum miscens]|uniref:ParB family chromosome partitioning protein n=1 Tax=Lactovum miscens TaxID=190387 RepID=A0A841C6W9_9LACT|nr:ParB/RepB/Spo0J family partition protein [Lactovum miscens]MBB5887342.1 ParB family chromosome partitioning protein [Lactovum miscens]
MTEEILNLKLSEIVRNPYQPRMHFDEEKLKELAKSITINGVLQPVIVRKSKVFGYELLAGERRFLASGIANLNEIPAIVRNYNDQQMQILALLENLQRENLNPIEEAKSLFNLTEKSGLKHEEIAQIIGKSRTFVSNTIRLLQLPNELTFLVESGELSAGHARALLAESDPIQQIELARLVRKKHLSVREIEQLIYHKDKNSRTKAKNIFIEEIEEKLKKEIGNTVKITENKHHQGNLSIKFNSIDELENLINKLSSSNF